MRGIAVLMVLAWHFVGAIIETDLGWWASAIRNIAILGRTGVDMFFVLSGYLITRILLARTQRDSAFLAVFYAKRMLRIFPPYFLLVGIFWGVGWLGADNAVFNDDTPLWRHLTFTQNFWMSDTANWGPGGISVTWSVAIEEQYYLVFPLLVLALPRSWLPATLCLIAVASILCRAILHMLHPDNAFLSYVMTFSRLDGLAVGGLIAWAFTSATAQSWMRSNQPRLEKQLKYLLGGMVVLAIAIKQNLAANMFYWGHTYLTVLYGLVVVVVVLNAGSGMVRWLRSSWMAFFGRTSYSVYLFHPLILSVVFLAAGVPETINNLHSAGLSVLAFLVTLVFCAALYRWFEKPILGYGARWKY